MRAATALFAVAGIAMSASAQATFTEVARINVDAQFNNLTLNGTNPSAVAWDGTNVFVAGFNGGTSAFAGIAHYDASGALLNEFGSQSTPGSRGYSGLDISGGVLAAAYDNGGASAQGLTAWDMGGNQLWAQNFRGGSGVGFDPGFGGVDAGVGSFTFGSGRRQLLNTADGTFIYDSSNGAIINGTGTGTFWRDMDYNDANGDVWIREGNNVIQGERTGGNSFSMNLVVDEPEADFVAGQNIAYMGGTFYGDMVIYNDRTATGLGQSASDVLKVIMSDGTAMSINYRLLGGIADDFATGAGYYDFSYDAASETLAVLDFSNRNVHIFSVPTPGAAALLGLGGLVASRRRRG